MKFYLDPWKANTDFVVGQGVDYGGVALYCTTAHTSTSTFDNTKFRALSPIDQWTSQLRNQFYAPNIIAVDAVKLSIPNANNVLENASYLRYCTGGVDLSLPDRVVNNSIVYETYTAQGDFMGFSTITEEFEVRVGKFEIYLSGLAPDLAKRFTGGPDGIDFEGCRVEIYRCFLDYEDMTLINNQRFPLFDGVIYNVKITESSSTCNITVECATLWADFERKKGRQSNNESNWLFQGNTQDRCFAKTATVSNVQMKWGSK